MKTQVVIGLGFGDEGKGLTVDMLVNEYQKTAPFATSLVVRFSGGHQAGHTVQKKRAGKTSYTHVFAQIGAGALSGAHTFYSKYCTFYPLAFSREYHSIGFFNGTDFKNRLQPVVYIDPMAPVTTVWDVAFNRVSEKMNNHGSCGVGFAATVKRHETCKVHAQDIYFPGVFAGKLLMVEKYYKDLCEKLDISYHLLSEEIEIGNKAEEYDQAIEELRNKFSHVSIKTESELFSRYGNIIFEGSQGVMLDMDFGFFPHVTRSNTTSKNAMEIIHRNGLPDPEIFYVTRCYQTRHGNGPMGNTEKVAFVREISEETNSTNDWQGSLRIGHMDTEMLRYAIQCDSQFHNSPVSLMVTCLDQVSKIHYISSGKTGQLADVKTLLGELKLPGLTKVLGSFSPFSADVKRLEHTLLQAQQDLKETQNL
jgi:adenylosuccinate synthase